MRYFTMGDGLWKYNPHEKKVTWWLRSVNSIWCKAYNQLHHLTEPYAFTELTEQQAKEQFPEAFRE